MKDHFSGHAAEYASFRPGYPEDLFRFIETLVPRRAGCWDVGTGSGQLAFPLADRFEAVFATDISARQIAHATRRANIYYSVQPAESTSFPEAGFDLVTVGQAIHWFDFEQFYHEVKRVTTQEGILLVAGYGLSTVDPAVDAIVWRLYDNIVGSYWDPERDFIAAGYRTIPFPFEEIPCPKLSMTCSWTVRQMTGYLRTWSAVRHYVQDKGNDPVEHIEQALFGVWPAGVRKQVIFPLLLRAGRVHGFGDM
ncbi:MAG: class I SAM-dependent methyltransferase [Saprospiraceae bacterium]|nr:class I SAM-dependent methyltransferase [Saprospiraceae bacterium]